jgi:hypothetical protein
MSRRADMIEGVYWLGQPAVRRTEWSREVAIIALCRIIPACIALIIVLLLLAGQRVPQVMI